MSSSRPRPILPASRRGWLPDLKWIGAVTSVLSLVFGLYQLTNLMAGLRERQGRLTELLGVETSQRTSGFCPRLGTRSKRRRNSQTRVGNLRTIMGRAG